MKALPQRYAFTWFFVTVALACTADATALTVMPLGDSLTEGLCTDGENTNVPASTCYEPYYESANAYVFNHYDTEPTFCGTFSQAMVENYNHGATGGYRGSLLGKLQAAGIATTYVGHVHSGTALAAPPLLVANPYHEGHGNWIAQQVAYCAGGYPAHGGVPAYAGYVASQHPEVVLLHVGTNDVLNGAAATSISNTVLTLQAQIGAVVPAPRLLIALIPTRYDFSGPTPQMYADFESRRKDLSALIAQNSGYDYPCTARDLPDMSVLDSGDFTSAAAAGGLHPNATGYTKMADVFAASITTPECRFDTRTFVKLGAVLIESISAYGRFWNFDTSNGALFEHGPLNSTDIPRYRSMCQGHAVCQFDTRTFTGSTGDPVESITAFNNYYTFSQAGALLSSGTLRSVARYNERICIYSAGPDACVFDTRAVLERNGAQVESITAYGRYFDFDFNTNQFLGSGLLSGSTQYAPICAYKPGADQFCTFDTRSFVQFPGNPYIEAITAYGRSWNFDANTGALVDSSALAANPRYKRAQDRVFYNGFE